LIVVPFANQHGRPTAYVANYRKTSNKRRVSKNAGVLKQHKLMSDYQPYTRFITATQTLSANTDNYFFCSQKADIS